MALDPADFDDLLEEFGQDVEWQHSAACPCRDPDSGAPDPDCRVCQNGQIWSPAVCTFVALSGQKVLQRWRDFGRCEEGDVVVTIPQTSKAYNMGQYDRILFIDSSEPFSTPILLGDQAKLRFRVASVESLFWLTPDKTAVIQGSIPRIADDGTIQFGIKAPPANTPYTITGRRIPEYFCFGDYPQDRAHFGGLPLPRKVVLRNFDLFSRAA